MASCSESSAQAKPNLLFIIVDDLNDLNIDRAGRPDVPTPNMDRLAARGVSFTNAHCNDPICAPSRASMLFGLYPQTSGLTWFEKWQDNAILNQCVSLPENLRRGGYQTFGIGKIHHGGRPDKGFIEWGGGNNFGPWPWNGDKKIKQQFVLHHPAQQEIIDGAPDVPHGWEQTFGPITRIPSFPADPGKGIPGYTGWRMGGKPWNINADGTRDLLGDEQVTNWSNAVIARKHDKPFAVFTGLVRTHTPLYAPQEYFDRFPLDKIELPKIAGDKDDCAQILVDDNLYGSRRYQMLAKHKGKDYLRQWIQAYMACVAFVDDQIGRLIDAVDASPYNDNTVIIVTSDHGFSLGEKEYLYKQSLWDVGTRVPLIVAGVPGQAKGVQCSQPVSLIDIYPTLNDLCGLNKDPHEQTNGMELEGHSIRPLLMNPKGGWEGPDVAITCVPGKDHMLMKKYDNAWYPHFSVRSERWRYTLCANGEEELYNHVNDELEWTNLASSPEHAGIKAELRKKLERLRDGENWEKLGDRDNVELAKYLVELKANCMWEGQIRDERYRIRLTGSRCQIYINNRLKSDVTEGGKHVTSVPLPKFTKDELSSGRLRVF
jgi:arylsulfatase A-like enzyme